MGHAPSLRAWIPAFAGMTGEKVAYRVVILAKARIHNLKEITVGSGLTPSQTKISTNFFEAAVIIIYFKISSKFLACSRVNSPTLIRFKSDKYPPTPKRWPKSRAKARIYTPGPVTTLSDNKGG